MTWAYNQAAGGGVTSTFRPPNLNSRVSAEMAKREIFTANDGLQALKACTTCGALKPASGFYGKQASCKECTKSRVRANRSDKLDYYRSYDRMRYRQDDDRKENARKCATSPAGLAAKARATARSRAEEPEKWKARNAVNNAVRDGRLSRGSECFFCGVPDKLQAHHHDYSKPLDVFWLCPACHGKLHTINGDFHRAKPEVR